MRVFALLSSFSVALFALQAPTNLVLTPTINSVHITWDDNANDETGYKIYRNGTLVTITPANVTQFTDTHLRPQTRYKYTIKATNQAIGKWERTNSGAGGAFSMIGSTVGGVLVAGSDLSGVYLSFDDGNHWEPLGEANGIMDSAVVSLGFHPSDPRVFYVGTTNGLYKTDNLGEKFTPVKAIVDAYENGNGMHIESIVSTNNGTTYVTYHSWDSNVASQIGKLTNNDTTFTALSVPEPNNNKLRIIKLLSNPNHPEKYLYALTGKPRDGCSDPKAYVLDLATNIWSKIYNGTDKVMDIALNPDILGEVYLSTYEAKDCSYNDKPLQPIKEKDFYKINHISNQVLSTTTNRSGIIAVNASGTNSVTLLPYIALTESYWSEDLVFTWKGTNGDTSWQPFGLVKDIDLGKEKDPSYAYTEYYGLDKTFTQDLFRPERIYGALGFTFASFDGGKKFHSLSSKEKTAGSNKWRSTGLDDINGHCLDVNDANNNIIYVGGYDIGLWYSDDHGAYWQRRSPKATPDNENYLWSVVDPQKPAGSNVTTLISDPDDPTKVWASFERAQYQAEADSNEWSGIFRSEDSGLTWSRVFPLNGELEKSYRFYGLSVDKSSPSGDRTLYVTIDGDLYKSTDDGRSWSIKVINGANHGLKFTAISNESQRKVIYVGGEAGLWRSTNNGQSFEMVGGSEMKSIHSNIRKDLIPTYRDDDNSIYPWTGVSSIVVDPNNPTNVYVSVFGENKGVYRSTQSGANGTWVKIFDNNYTRSVAINPHDSNMVFVTSSQAYDSGGSGGSSKGVQYTRNINATPIAWEDASDGMAWKFAGTIEIETGDNPNVWVWSPGTGVQFAPLR